MKHSSPPPPTLMKGNLTKAHSLKITHLPPFARRPTRGICEEKTRK